MSDEHEHDHDPDDHEGHDHGHEVPPLTADQHREQGVTLFNQVWEMLETPSRTAADDDQMVHAAHASRWHWSQAGAAGGNQQLAVGEWQCARVYAVAGRGEPALHHARACLAICEDAGLGDWVLAAAYEALARASAVAGDVDQARAWLERARRGGNHRRAGGPRGDRGGSRVDRSNADPQRPLGRLLVGRTGPESASLPRPQ